MCDMLRDEFPAEPPDHRKRRSTTQESSGGRQPLSQSGDGRGHRNSRAANASSADPLTERVLAALISKQLRNAEFRSSSS